MNPFAVLFRGIREALVGLLLLFVHYAQLMMMLLLLGAGFWIFRHYDAEVAHLSHEVQALNHAYVQGGASDVPSKSATVPAESCDWIAVRRSVRNTVVQVFSYSAEFNWLEPYKAPNQGGARGSGFFISDSGDIITNAHVVDQSKAVFIQIPSQGKRQFKAKVVGVCMERDIALLRLYPDEVAIVRQTLNGTIPVLGFADSDKVLGSEEIMTLGFPLGQQSLKGTTGIVSGRERINGQYMIQISAPINPGTAQ